MKYQFVIGVTVGMLCSGCLTTQVERKLADPALLKSLSDRDIQAMEKSSPFLKAHMKDGSLYLFREWRTEGGEKDIHGAGTLFNPSRDSVAGGMFKLGLDSIALLETNRLKYTGSGMAMTIFTGITAGIAIYCRTNPKACFGSCPTFYVSDGDSLRLQAEGFSSSIAPSLEASDIDALYHARPVGNEVSITMKNEALETHVVRSVDLLAVPRMEGCRVFAGKDGRFWECREQIHPVAARGPEGNCLGPIWDYDGIERISLADESYLATKETIGLVFHPTPGHTYGLIFACRQSLLPTYLLYQAFAYMGNDAGYWLARTNHQSLYYKKGSAVDLIGGIEISICQAGGSLRSSEEINEHGPLAIDSHVLPLGLISDTTLDVELKMTKGAWRIDYVALTEISPAPAPVRIRPGIVLKDGKTDPIALANLNDSSQTLVTLPGDSYILQYKLPNEFSDCELFLESRGYYLEWIRKAWLKEENPFLLAEMLATPERALRRLAPEFKRVEPQMEECFWRSRYAKP